MKPSFAFKFVLSITMSFVIGFVMCIAMTLHNHLPFEPVALGLQLAVATVIGSVVMLTLPVAPLAEKFALFYGAERDGLFFGIFQALVINTVMTFCVSFGMTAFATGFATFPDGTTFLVRWLSPIVAIWGTAYLTTLLTLPIATAVAKKVG
jgi:hypothetical protein